MVSLNDLSNRRLPRPPHNIFSGGKQSATREAQSQARLVICTKDSQQCRHSQDTNFSHEIYTHEVMVRSQALTSGQFRVHAFPSSAIHAARCSACYQVQCSCVRSLPSSAAAAACLAGRACT